MHFNRRTDVRDPVSITPVRKGWLSPPLKGPIKPATPPNVFLSLQSDWAVEHAKARRYPPLSFYRTKKLFSVSKT